MTLFLKRGGRHAILLLVLLFHIGCGLGPLDDTSGGAANLPTLGAGPYQPLEADFDTPIDEPYVVAQPFVSLLDPSVIRDSAGDYTIFYSRLSDTEREIWSISLSASELLPTSSPKKVLAADQEWEAGETLAPSVVQVGDELVLFYNGGAGGIGRAVSADGINFVKDQGPLLTQGRHPSISQLDREWILVASSNDSQTIELHRSSDGVNFGAPSTILSPRDSATAFDRFGLRAPELRIQQTATGRLHYGLFYTGNGGTDPDEPLESIGYIGSFDTIIWERFLDGEPILDPGPAGASGAYPLLNSATPRLFYHQLRQGRGRIAIATP